MSETSYSGDGSCIRLVGIQVSDKSCSGVSSCGRCSNAFPALVEVAVSYQTEFKCWIHPALVVVVVVIVQMHSFQLLILKQMWQQLQSLL